MKVLVPTVYDTRGGSTRVLLASAAALRAEHWVVVRAPLAEADDPAPALFPSRPLVGLWRKLAVLPRLGGLVLREAGALRRLRPDLVHVHDEPSFYVYGLAARLVRPRPRILWHLHLDPSRGRLAPLRGRLADACITISSHICAPTGLPASLIRNPLTLPDAIPEAAHDPLSSMAVVGAIYPQKGQDLAIHALAALRRHPAGGGARLTLIGPELDAAYAARLRATIQALGLTAAVDFAGPRAPARAFEGVGLALFPSRSEIQPLALAEALARGLPVVASDIPAHRVMIAETGGDPRGLCREDAEAMASALLDAASAAPPAGLAQRVRDLYSPHTFATDLLALYRTIAPRARS